jgi:hypothetical protein
VDLRLRRDARDMSAAFGMLCLMGFWRTLFSRRPNQSGALDLRPLPSVTCRVRGLKYYLHGAPRVEYQGRGYLLVREPTNQHDRHAIAVYQHGVKVGFLAASRASSTAPLLDTLGAPAYRVEGNPDGHGRVLLNMPTVPALRELAALRNVAPAT